MSSSSFNGRHVTTIVCAVCAAIVLAPLSVFAATSPAKVFITDKGTPSHTARVSSSGALSVTGNVTTTPGRPVTPFSMTVGSGVPPTTITVPSGKHLEIETISIQADVTSGRGLEAFVDYTTGGNAATLFVPLTFAQTEGSGYDVYVAMQNVRLTADPGSTVKLEPNSVSGSTGTSFLTVSGYLV